MVLVRLVMHSIRRENGEPLHDTCLSRGFDPQEIRDERSAKVLRFGVTVLSYGCE